MHYIGIDIGTSSISCVAYNYEMEKIESVTIDNDSNLPSTLTWEKTQSPRRIMQIVENIMEDFYAQYPNIRGIGVTGQMHGILYVNEQGEAVSPLYTWQDGRGNQPCRDDQTYAMFLSEQTGYTLATGFGLVTHFYNQVQRLVPNDAKKLCTIMDYAVMKLAGRKKPLTDYSNGAGLGFFDLEKLRFDSLALKKAGIELSLLPELAASATLCGYYKEHIPVYSAIGDNQAAFLGSVKDIRNSIHITVGTGSQISIYSDRLVKIPALDTRPFPGGGYLLVGASLCGGQAFVALKDFFEKTLKMLTGNSFCKSDIYSQMSTVFYKDDSNDLPIVETLFNGTRCSPEKRGSIKNMSLNNFTPENLILGFLKGISRELYNYYQRLPKEIKKGKNRIIGSGNALKKNPLLCEAFEEQFNTELLFSTHEEEAALGACLNAMASGQRTQNG